MKKNLLTLMFVVMCAFLLNSTLVAAPKINNMNLDGMTNSLSFVKSKVSVAKGKKIEAMYKELLKKCSNSTAWTCEQAMAHFDESAAYMASECEADGYGDWCGQLQTWVEDTWAWAQRKCANELAITVLKPKKTEIRRFEMEELKKRVVVG